MNRKVIWIVNYYTSSPDKCSNPRYLEFSRFFREKGYEVLTFNSNMSEKLKLIESFIEKTYGDYNFVHVKSPNYVGNGLKRIYSIWAFAWSVFKHRKHFAKPDIILHNLHTPFDYPIFWTAKRLGAKYIAESWDPWPEAFSSTGFISDNHPAMKIAYAIERHIYENADQVIFTYEGGLDYLKDKGWTIDTGGKVNPSKVHYINNGINLEAFDRNAAAHPRADADMNDSSTYKIIYLGSIRLVNKVKQVIEAANILKSNPRYRFFIYGDGPDRENLEQFVADKQIDNVVFKEKHIPLEECAWVVSQATVNLMNYQKDFGIHGVSSGKMFQYLAAGKPICCNVKINYSEISRNNLGIDRELNTPEEYAEAIRTLAEQSSDDYNAMCERVRRVAQKYDYKVLCEQELRAIEQ